MINILLTSLAGLVTFIGLDYIWLAHVAKKFYLSELASHITLKDGGLVTNPLAIPFVYIVALLGIWVFALSKVTSGMEAFGYGALFGFILYAFYDFTNAATFKDYSWSITCVDIIWGTILVGIVTTVMFYIKSALA